MNPPENLCRDLESRAGPGGEFQHQTLKEWPVIGNDRMVFGMPVGFTGIEQAEAFVWRKSRAAAASEVQREPQALSCGTTGAARVRR